ncbi:MAG: MgtC/SapB family protein [Verrucomicrobiota bacterium]
MAIQLGWDEILWRLVLTLIAGAVIGLNRSEHDRPAGLRTTMLVCLAASVTMIQVNLLLGMSGKTPSSFAVMDLMRLPLGILTGVGFIGAGAILKKGDLIRGVTTAATLWYVTVIGLCLGGGQLALGMTATGLGWIILTLLKSAERHWNSEHHGILKLVCEGSGPDCEEARRMVESLGAQITRWTREQRRRPDGYRENVCAIKWNGSPDNPAPPPFVEKFSERPGVVQVDWEWQV